MTTDSEVGKDIKLLDYGYLRLVDFWGSDQMIVESARMSTGKGFLGWGPEGVECPQTGCGWSKEDAETTEIVHERVCPKCGNYGLRTILGDEKLLRHLYKNAHATPFEVAGAMFEVKAPIFVFREWHRHRTQTYNEMSARYTPLPDECYVPVAEDAVARSVAASAKNKQAGVVDGAEVLTKDVARSLVNEEMDLLEKVEDLYQRKLKAGFTKELARTHLTVSRYSRMRASANLRNWMGFLTLRMAPGAQYEIRVYAQALHDELSRLFPRTLALFDEGMKK